MKKDEALNHVSELIKNIHDDAKNASSSMFGIGKDKYVDLAKKCALLEQSINIASNSDNCFILEGTPIRSLIIDLEIEYSSIRGSVQKSKLYYSILIVIVMFFLFMFFYKDISDYIKDEYKIDNAGKYMIIGWLGALIYFLLDIIIDIRQDVDINTEKSSRIIFGRVVLAVFMPILLIIIFNPASDGQKFNPNIIYLLSFTMGYSYKVIVLLLDKILEKAQNIIKAL
ncbi:hypothetical protein [Methylomonas sp. UP202]|uniref:hypothetical protein n=1 Tax=Methylomonas sp. UP202 TaxID=3040943 RepID=UPI00247AADAD|nr:hypothetical protein [Methylomonas sp. UP202]WGS87627.1 hypothetical protein QC632_07665 [Methylomonas sp. UP202]